MTATRLAFSSALVLILSAFVCNAQVAPPDMEFYMVYVRNERGSSGCFLNDLLKQNEIERLGNQQLRCSYVPSPFFEIPCFIEEQTCESVQNICNSLNGKIVMSNSCEELVGRP